MTLPETLEALRELGVYIPDSADTWDDAQLTKLGKLLNPWTVSVSMDGNLYSAHTRQDTDKVWYPTSAAAVFGLLLLQLQQGRFSAADTSYKQSAMAYRATNH